MLLCLAAVLGGGFLGGLARWALSFLNRGRVHAGTWAANTLGSAALGFSIGLPGILPLLVGTGFAGACSTLSTLSRELGELVRARRWAALASYVVLTAGFGVAAAWAGAAAGAGIGR